MKTFLDWLFNKDDPKRKRTVKLWVDNGSGAVQVGIVEVSYEQIKNILNTFDSLEQLFFRLPDEED